MTTAPKDSESNPSEPHRPEEGEWIELARILDRFFGEREFAELAERFANIAAAEVARMPATFLRRFQEAANATLDSRPQPTDATLESALFEGIATLDRMARAAEGNPATLGSPAGRTALGLVRGAASVVGAEAVLDVVAKVGLPRLRTWRTMSAIMALARIADNVDLGEFEDATRTAARIVKDAHELWYGPLVLTYRSVGALDRGVSPLAEKTVGQAESDLRSWGAAALVDPTARKVRNAEAHGGIDLDLTTGTVRFLSVDGKTAVAGPWDRDNFRDNIKAFFALCATLSWTLVAFVASETQSAVCQQIAR